jgi:hypothetical protein
MYQSKILKLALMLVALVSIGAMAQISANAEKIPDDCIVLPLDGQLTEGVWTAYAANKATIPGSGANITTGTISGDADASCQFLFLWDSKGIYCGSWNQDDIHGANMCKFVETANDAYQDDAHEYYINVDYANASTGGNLGSQDVCGFNEEGFLYAGGWGASNLPGGPPIGTWGNFNLTIEQLRTQFGWDVNGSSADGVKFNVESFWSWTGCFLQKVGSKAVGSQFGFDLSLCDNDGTGSPDGVILWSTLGARPADHWKPVTLVDNDTEIPHKTTIIKKDNLKTVAYDVFGRAISNVNKTNYKGIIFTVDNTNKVIKRIASR